MPAAAGHYWSLGQRPKSVLSLVVRRSVVVVVVRLSGVKSSSSLVMRSVMVGSNVGGKVVCQFLEIKIVVSGQNGKVSSIVLSDVVSYVYLISPRQLLTD